MASAASEGTCGISRCPVNTSVFGINVGNSGGLRVGLLVVGFGFAVGIASTPTGWTRAFTSRPLRVTIPALRRYL